MKDLGLDPADKQARKMIDRVDKQLVFKWLNSGPYLHGETEPGINGRILGIGAYFKQPNDALANRLLGEQLNHVTHEPGFAATCITLSLR